MTFLRWRFGVCTHDASPSGPGFQRSRFRDVTRTSSGVALPCKRNQDADQVFLSAGQPSAFHSNET